MRIPRIYNDLTPHLRLNKVLVLFGPRQAGKTTLVRSYLEKTDLKYRLETGEDIIFQRLIASDDVARLTEYARGYDLIVVDEAQRARNIGTGLKLIVDHVPGIRVLATGSSSFELAGQVGEPLTGRKTTLMLYPVSQLELLAETTPFDLQRKLDEYLIFGSYPEVLCASGSEEKVRLLTELTGSYLLKDILELERIKGSRVLLDLLRLLAFQIGSEVSHHELGRQLGLDGKTVGRYLDLLEKAFVLLNLRGFSRNLRKEVSKKSKYFFYDTGIRNALIANFNCRELRNDIGQLWENFLMIERIKSRTYLEIHANSFFWRVWNGQEIDLVEEHQGRLDAYEFKWGGKTPVCPPLFASEYPNHRFAAINRENYLTFVSAPGSGLETRD